MFMNFCDAGLKSLMRFAVLLFQLIFSFWELLNLCLIFSNAVHTKTENYFEDVNFES